eukprot:355400-Chlamydomonas_euryale.AAC.8
MKPERARWGATAPPLVDEERWATEVAGIIVGGGRWLERRRSFARAASGGRRNLSGVERDRTIINDAQY